MKMQLAIQFERGGSKGMCATINVPLGSEGLDMCQGSVTTYSSERERVLSALCV